MSDVFSSSWFYWSIGIAVGLPLGMVFLTEWQQSLRRRQSVLEKPVGLLRNYLLPLSALLLLMLEARQIPSEATSVRVVSTLVAFVVLVLLLSGINATVFQGAPDGSWRKRMPSIFLDVVRFVLIAVGLGMIFAYIWGANVKGLFTALGVTSIVVGLTLQNSVGQIISGLLMLFEQPFKLGDWIETPAAKGRVVEVNWRSVHLETASGLHITPNSVLATATLANLSRPHGKHTMSLTHIFAVDDPPDQVCAMLTRVASQLPQCDPKRQPSAFPAGAKSYQTQIPLKSPSDNAKAKAEFLRWIWYAARREGLRLDEAVDDFPTPERILDAIKETVGPTLRLDDEDEHAMVGHVKLWRYGAGEMMQAAGSVPEGISFIVSGSVQLTATAEDGAQVPVDVLEESSFLGQTTLTRQPVLGWAYALEEVTVVYLERELIATVIHQNPVLIQEFGRMIEERRANLIRAVAPEPEPEDESAGAEEVKDGPAVP